LQSSSSSSSSSWSSAAFVVLRFCPDKLTRDIFAYKRPSALFDKFPLKWTYFGTVSFTQDLPHPHRKLSKKWADRAFALHQWSMHQGKPEQRINRVKELGYLFVEERPPAACDRLPH